MPPGGTFDFNWPRIAKLCLYGALIMFGWLLLPTLRCSWATWNDTPISEETKPDDSQPGEADKSRLHEERGFFDKLGTGVKQCYAKTPLLDQEGWKTNLLYTFTGAAVLAYLIGKLQSRGGRSYTP